MTACGTATTAAGTCTDFGHYVIRHYVRPLLRSSIEMASLFSAVFSIEMGRFTQDLPALEECERGAAADHWAGRDCTGGDTRWRRGVLFIHATEACCSKGRLSAASSFVLHHISGVFWRKTRVFSIFSAYFASFPGLIRCVCFRQITSTRNEDYHKVCGFCDSYYYLHISLVSHFILLCWVTHNMSLTT